MKSWQLKSPLVGHFNEQIISESLTPLSLHSQSATTGCHHENEIANFSRDRGYDH